MRVVIAGSSGFIGAALVARLRGEEHDVVRLVRRTTAGPDEVTWSPEERTLGADALAGADVVVNLAGAGVGDHRWSAAYKRTIQRSRVDTTITLAHAVAAGVTNGGPTVLVNASAVGFYGDRGDERLNEDSPPGDGFLPDVCRSWEGATQAAEDAGARVVHLRSGLVLGPRSGLLGRMMPLFRAGAGGRLGTGRQWMSWIALPDEVAAIRYAMEHDLRGPVNLTAPAPVRNEEFTKVLAAAVKRPAMLRVPAMALRVALGEFSSEALSSSYVEPAVLVAAGFAYRYPDIQTALAWATTA